VAVIHLPPLRERREDIPSLVDCFMHRHGAESGGAIEPKIQADALEWLQGMSWPGNVRELENVVRRALMSSHGIINLSDVQEAISQDASDPTVVALVPRDQTISVYVSEILAKVMQGEMTDAHARVTLQTERELYSQAIQLALGDQSKAARWLGVSRPTMREKLVRFGLLPNRESKSDCAA